MTKYYNYYDISKAKFAKRHLVAWQRMQHSAKLSAAAAAAAAAAEAAASLCATGDEDGNRFVGSLPAPLLHYNLLRHIRDSVINRSDLSSQSDVSHRWISYSASILAGAVLLNLLVLPMLQPDWRHILHALRCQLQAVEY